MKNPQKDILLSGTMRSGTTLMCSILDAHPDIMMISELLQWYWQYCYPKYGNMETDYQLERALYELEPHMVHHYNIIDLNYVIEKVKNRGISYLTLYYVLCEELYYDKMKPIIGVKSTHAAYDYKNFLNSMPNPYVIHMVRNCRDVYYSHKRRVTPPSKTKNNILRKVYRKFKNRRKQFGRYLVGKKLLLDDRIFDPYLFKNPIRLIDEWRITNEIALELKREMPDRVIIVRFEDLLTNTTNTLIRLLEKIGVPWIEGFHTYDKLKNRDGKRFEANTSFTDRNITGYTDSHLYKSIELLTASEQDYYYKIAKETDEKLGYCI